MIVDCSSLCFIFVEELFVLLGLLNEAMLDIIQLFFLGGDCPI